MILIFFTYLHCCQCSLIHNYNSVFFSWQINCSNCSNGRRHIVVEMTQSVFSETVRLINRSDNNKCDNGLPDICEDYAVIIIL